MRRCVALALLSLTLVTLAILSCSGQGLQPLLRSKVSATQVTNTFTFRQQYLASQRTRQQKLLKSSCRNGRPGTVCAGMSSNTSQDDAELMLAASPDVYSSLDTTYSGGVRLVSPPGDQGDCHTCAAFAVASAAETAMASVLGVDVANCSVSVQALHFCPPKWSREFERECKGGWPLKETTARLSASWPLPTTDCLEYKPLITQSSLDDICISKCETPSPYAKQGTFGAIEITTWVRAQQHIRQYGGVVSTFDVMTGFKSFFKNPANRKAVFRPSPGAGIEELHAVVLVGYNNKEEYWLAKNSWGTDQGDGGYFKVAYNTCSILTGDKWEAYGLIWKPNDPQLKGPVVRLSQGLSRGPRAGCYQYTVRSGDYLSKISWLANVPLEQLLRDNAGVLADFNTPPKGTKLLICNPELVNQLGGRKLGCYADYAKAMDGAIVGHPVSKTAEGHGYYGIPALEGDTTTVDACAKLARREGYEYFALQNGDQCRLSNDLDRQLKCPESRDCNQPCTGNQTQICGGPWVNSVYRLASKDAIAVPSYSYVGCYRENCLATRALPEFVSDDKLTPSKCAEYARRAGHSIYGLQAGAECFHGSNLSRATRYGKLDEAACYVKCAGAELLDCGGWWANTLYTLDP